MFIEELALISVIFFVSMRFFYQYPQKNPLVKGLHFVGHMASVNHFQSNN
jgi:hypothetical protein